MVIICKYNMTKTQKRKREKTSETPGEVKSFRYTFATSNTLRVSDNTGFRSGYRLVENTDLVLILCANMMCYVNTRSEST